MPTRPITVRRWQIGAAFALVVIAFAGSLQLSYRHVDQRIDAAEKRISMNTERIAAARAKAAVAEQNATNAKEVADTQKHTIKVLCGEIKVVKAQILATLRSSRGSAQKLVGRIPGYTQADADLAEQRLQQALRRFAPRPCPPKNGGE